VLVPYSEERSQELLQKIIKIREDPMEFLRGVRTLDESDEDSPIKHFPVHMDYIKLYVRVWQKEKGILVPKSRRMRMSWINIALYVWDTMFHIGRHNAFVSKKEDDADFLIRERAKFIIDNLDHTIIPKEIVPKYTYTYNLLEFKELHSKIQGFPQGADQARQFTLSGMFADEFAFWDKAEDTYSSAKPCLEGGGRFTGVSSPAPGFFKRMVLDKINAESAAEIDRAASFIDKKYPMQGISIWRNKDNKFLVFECHYKADPGKRSAEWLDRNKSGIPIKKWNQEYELMWDTYSGTPVYPDFKPEIHLTQEKLKPHIGIPLLRGWDFGLTPACIFAQLQEDNLIVFKEITASNMGADRFSDIVVTQSRQLYPNWSDLKNDWLEFIDPSGVFRKDTDESSCADIIGPKIGPINLGEVTWEKRRKSVEDLLTKFYRGKGKVIIVESECPILVAGFKGGSLSRRSN
jgi:hypothetical protein